MRYAKRDILATRPADISPIDENCGGKYRPIAIIHSDRQAVKTGIFHLLSNVASICIGLLCFPLFVRFIEWISNGAQMEQKIANAHMIFNTASLLLIVPFIPWIEKMLNTWLPSKTPAQPGTTVPATNPV
ncbi:MAG: hypothetical protein ABW019_09990 [Chitinophagaceae bacterium]